MEAKETAGLLMTEREARDCSSGLLETTSNRPWSAAKENTHQLLQKKKKEKRREATGEGGGGGCEWKKEKSFSSKVEMYVRGSKRHFGSMTERMTGKKNVGAGGR